MAKNLSERLLDMVEVRSSFTGLEPGAVLVWLKVARFISGEGSFAGLVDPRDEGTWAKFADLFEISEAELERHILSLIDRELLLTTNDGLILPWWRQIRSSGNR
jgi:hypothetical protein